MLKQKLRQLEYESGILKKGIRIQNAKLIANEQKVKEYDQLWGEHQKILSELHQYKLSVNSLLRTQIGDPYM